MQTFLPYESYVRSAQCLDMRRLGKQRVEVLQILKALNGLSRGWANHPAVRMWRGYRQSLVVYGKAICEEWTRRGYSDSTIDKILAFCKPALGEEPNWLGQAEFHASHRSNLLRKDPVHYGKFGWAEPNDLPYIWPTSDREGE